jgi:LAGLIDADG DNA endonuclease family protein
MIIYLVSPTPVIKNSQQYFHTRCRAINRIGPHNIDVLSVMVGLLLGDGYLNNRTGEGVRMAIKQSIVHKEYLFSLYDFFYNRGYCSSLEPRLYTRRLKGKETNYYGYEFNTFTFRSLVWLHKLFYSNGKKVIPANIGDLITPLSLAI